MGIRRIISMVYVEKQLLSGVRRRKRGGDGMKVFHLSLLMCKMNLCNGVHALDETIPCPHCAEVTA